MVLSVLVALILTPALCATHPARRRSHAASSGLFGWFNRNFDRGARRLSRRRARHDARGRCASSLLFVAHRRRRWACCSCACRARSCREEDQGVLITIVQLPVGATQDRTLRVLEQVTRLLPRRTRRTRSRACSTVDGFGFAGAGPERRHGLRQAASRSTSARRRSSRRRRWPGAPWWRSPRFATRRSSRWRRRRSRARQLERLRFLSAGHRRRRPRQADGGAQPAARRGRRRASCSPATRPNGQDDTPQFAIDIDQEKASALGLSISPTSTPRCRPPGAAPTSTTSSTAAASSRSICRRTPDFRMQPEDLDRWYVRNASGEMVPFSAFASGALDLRLAAARALQRLVRRRDPGRGRAGRQLRRGDGRDRAARRRSCRPASAMNGPACREQERLVRQPGDVALRDLDPGRVPVPRRALRELVDPARRHAVGADRHPRRAGWPRCCSARPTTSTSRSAC